MRVKIFSNPLIPQCRSLISNYFCVINPTPVGRYNISIAGVCEEWAASGFLSENGQCMFHKVAILIDGGFFLQRFKANMKANPRVGDMQPFLDEVMRKVQKTTKKGTDTLFRAFYYDCRPYGEIQRDPNGKLIDFSQNPQFTAATRFQNDLRTFPQMALRLGDLSFDGWKIDTRMPGAFVPDFKQKSVDIKIGLDIAWMSSKKTINKIVLVAGDSDFISPMKFARREGIQVYLDCMNQTHVKMSLKEHADFLI